MLFAFAGSASDLLAPFPHLQAVPEWDPSYFQVLDVAARIGSGVGSYGVNRYYVLLQGTDTLLREGEGGAVILDGKSPIGLFSSDNDIILLHLWGISAQRLPLFCPHSFISQV